MIELLRGKLGDDLKGKKVVELGSGTGLAGLCAAAVGAHVLMSDIATVTDFSLRPNVERNGGLPGGSEVEGAWPGSGRVGDGSATCMAIDWTKGVDEQAKAAGQEPCDCDVVLAAECVWLVELVEPFVKTVRAVEPLLPCSQPHCSIVSPNTSHITFALSLFSAARASIDGGTYAPPLMEAHRQQSSVNVTACVHSHRGNWTVLAPPLPLLSGIV